VASKHKVNLWVFAYVKYRHSSSNSFSLERDLWLARGRVLLFADIFSFTPAHWVKKGKKAKSLSQFTFLPVKLRSGWVGFKIANIKALSRLCF